VYGGGAVEMALSVALQQEAEQVPGLEQYALAAFGKALKWYRARWRMRVGTPPASLPVANRARANLTNAGGEDMRCRSQR
jgi:hypothetical protein